MIKGILNESWNILNEASIFIIFGFFVAGMLHVFLSREKIEKYLGGNSFSSIIYASLLGVPLPLCSCAVAPAAVSLRKHGASKGATLSFLISTPESGVDSIAITYAMLDPILTVYRPFSAFVTALFAGFLEKCTAKNDNGADGSINESIKQECKLDNCCLNENDSDHSHTFKENVLSGLRHGFSSILTDVSKWLLIGIVAAGFISYFIPEHFFENYVGTGFSSMLIMLVVGIPIYICATASTPIAAAMIYKGLNPGAALVFLLAGPATNTATLLIVGRLLGKRATSIYLFSLTVLPLLLGVLLNNIYFWWDIIPQVTIGHHKEFFPYWLRTTCSVLLLVLTGYAIWIEWKKKGACECH